MTFENAAELILEEQSLRDGLQTETVIPSLADKLKLIHMMRDAGLKRIQVGSFVHPGLVPQMAQTDKLAEMIGDIPGMLITGLVLNDRGLERAVSCGLQHLTISTSVSTRHSLKNFRKTKEEALRSLIMMIRKSVDRGIVVRAGVQCAFGCTDAQEMNNDFLFEVLGLALENGAAEINLADTEGVATPFQVKQLVTQVNNSFPDAAVSLHLHDSRGLAMANLFAGYEAGVRIFDTCVGGLGGCPFVHDAAGNAATEDVVNLFHSSSIPTGIDIERLCSINLLYQKLLGKMLPGRICRLNKACQTASEEST